MASDPPLRRNNGFTDYSHPNQGRWEATAEHSMDSVAVSERKKKSDAVGSPMQLEGKLQSFKRLYGAASLEQEKQKLLQRFQERKDRALSSGNGAPANRSRPGTASMHRSSGTGAKAGNGGTLRPRGEREWDQLPKRPQTAFGFAGMSGMNPRLHAERTVSWQDDAASPLGSKTERSRLSWDTEELGRVSSLGLISDGASEFSQERASASIHAGEMGREPEEENDLEVVGGHRQGPNEQAQCDMDAGNSISGLDRFDPEERDAVVLKDVSNSCSGAKDLKGRGGSGVTIAEQSGADADCDVVIDGLCSAADSEDEEAAASASWSDQALRLGSQLHGAGSQAPNGYFSEGEADSHRLSRATGERPTLMAGWSGSQSGCKLTSSEAKPEWGSRLGSPDQILAAEASFDRIRPSSSIPSLRQAGLSASIDLSSDKWRLHSRPGRAFSAPSSRTASPSMQGGRVEVRTRVAFSCEQYGLYRDGVSVQRTRMVRMPGRCYLHGSWVRTFPRDLVDTASSVLGLVASSAIKCTRSIKQPRLGGSKVHFVL